jgi:acyl-CoA reductase-like NAD-dependent aldehyde dehydrogenase
VPPPVRRHDAREAIERATDAIRAEVEALESPLERARAVTALLEVLREQQAQVADLRVGPVGELRQAGMSLRAIADALDLSLNAVVQIDNEHRGRPRWRPRRP